MKKVLNLLTVICSALYVRSRHASHRTKKKRNGDQAGGVHGPNRSSVGKIPHQNKENSIKVFK